MRLENKTILIVDDEHVLRMLVRQVLEVEGYELIEADCGEKALQILQERKPDLVMLDIVMEGMSGFEVCEAMKNDASTCDIPVIMLTGLSSTEDLDRGFRSGADDFLSKPFKVVELRARVRSHLSTKSLHDELQRTNYLLHNETALLKTLVDERAREIEATQLSALIGFAKLTEWRDIETGFHLERMQNYSRIIADGLRDNSGCGGVIDPTYVDMIYRSSPLHDIGKVGIPDSILIKPGRLTPEEWEIMKTHTTIGGETLAISEKALNAAKKSYLSMARAIATYHHERWDGSGYPIGLREEEIPLCARVVALADVYDALTSTRCYKAALTHEKSMRIIREGIGCHFDPEVVKAFIASESQVLAVKEKFSDEA